MGLRAGKLCLPDKVLILSAVALQLECPGAVAAGSRASQRAQRAIGRATAGNVHRVEAVRARAQAGNAGSNDMGLTDTSAQANGYQCAAVRGSFPGDADALEGEGSGSNPTGAALAAGLCCANGLCWQVGREGKAGRADSACC